jgi:hypothetical protein
MATPLHVDRACDVAPIKQAGFDAGSIGTARMGIVDSFRIPKRSWYWYRNACANVPPPEWPRAGTRTAREDVPSSAFRRSVPAPLCYDQRRGPSAMKIGSDNVRLTDRVSLGSREDAASGDSHATPKAGASDDVGKAQGVGGTWTPCGAMNEDDGAVRR